ncbi:MAG: hypothetical protein UZ07_CHB004001492 [Chlorobi bacterium OLB7]|nr:MAG: hypothetical protein UZ07_CHB004001492 [Chlorobi bacterium OLB7]
MPVSGTAAVRVVRPGWSSGGGGSSGEWMEVGRYAVEFDGKRFAARDLSDRVDA